MQRATRALSRSNSTSDTGVFSTQAAKSGREPVRTPMRPASGFSSFTPDTKKASWEELSRERDDGGETKNYSVPPELIELARANRKARGQVGTLTPLAPKPAQDVVVVVPSAAPVAADLRAAELDAEGVLQAPSVPIPLGQANNDPDSSRTVVAGPGYAAAASAPPSAPPSSATPASTATSPLAEMMRSELAVARGPAESSAGEPSAAEPSAAESSAAELPKAQPDVTNATEAELAKMVESTGVRRTSRRAPRSLRIEMPGEASAAARAASAATAKRKNYVPVALGACIVGAYVVLCYYANAMLANLP